MTSTDILIVGGGMAGFSIAARLAGKARVLLIEQEEQPAYHSSGRSVAFWEETYGGPGVQPLTSASGPLLRAGDYLSPRTAFHIGQAGDAPLREAMLADFAGSGVTFETVGRAGLEQVLPGLRPGWEMAVAEPSCSDIDAAGLLAGYRRDALRAGLEIRLSTRLGSARREGAGWRVDTSAGSVSCAILINAAGAWADDVARRCGLGDIGIVPYRRTVVQLRCPQAPAHVPLIAGLRGDFYFKSEGAGRLWLSPHDETPDVPRDVVPEELDVALAIHRFEQVVDWKIEAVEHKWAGLRSFAPDRLPVYGYDPRTAGFFWFAGQGGFGIQTAPAAALIGGALVLGEALPGEVASIDAGAYSPGRLIAG